MLLAKLCSIVRSPRLRSLLLSGLGWIFFGMLGAPTTGCRKTASSEAQALEDPALIAARKAWRAQQDGQLRGELSPLARVDYVHLPEGEYLLDADAAPFKLSAAAMAPYQGEIRLRVFGGHLQLGATPPLPRNGTPVSSAELVNGDVLKLGRLRLFITGTPADRAIAVYDIAAPARRDYQGLHYYDDDPRYVAHARLERYPDQRTVRIAASRGEDKEMLAVGLLRFHLLGQAASMEAYAEGVGSDRLFLIFRDQTNGQPGKSYGAGRYLYAKPQRGPDGAEEVLLDFNQAWNPLCAYSAYFHCPLPPRSNWLELAIPVGEQVYHADH